MVVGNGRLSSPLPQRVLGRSGYVHGVVLSQIAGILGANVASVFGAAMDADAREGQVVIGLNLVTHGNYLNLNTSVDIF